MVGLDQRSGFNVGLLNSMSEDWGHDIGLAVDNGGALVGDGGWDTVDMLSYFGHDWLLNNGNTGLNLNKGLAGDHLLLECGQWDRSVDTWSGIGQGGNQATWGSSDHGKDSRQHHLWGIDEKGNVRNALLVITLLLILGFGGNPGG